MLILKLLAPIIVFAIALLKEFWPEKIKSNDRWKQVFLVVMAVGALVSIVVIIHDDSKTNKEKFEQQARYQDLQVKFDNIITLSKNQDVRSDERGKFLQERIMELSTKLEPFIKLAVAKYPQQNVDEGLELLRKEIAETKEMAKPNSISLSGSKTEVVDGGYKVLLQFKPSKNIPLGLLEFSAILPKSSHAKITQLWPTLDGGAFQSGNSPDISSDGKSAKVAYSLIGAGLPTIELRVTAPTRVTINGNNGLVPFSFEIK